MYVFLDLFYYGNKSCSPSKKSLIITIALTDPALLIAIDNINAICEIGLLMKPSTSRRQ